MSATQEGQALERQQPKAVSPVVQLRRMLESDSYKKRFEQVLGKHANEFMASLTSLVSGDNYLQKCAPDSIIASAFIAATLQLPINKNLGYAWIVPYWDKKSSGYLAQFQIGWKGYVQLALRTGLYANINAFPVNKEARGPYNEVGEPIIYFDKLDKSKPAVGYACAWKLTTGFVKVVYWSKEEVLAHAERYSQAYQAGRDDPKKRYSPWFTEEGKMCLKTVVSNSLKQWGIMSIETRQMQIAAEHDQGVQPYIDGKVMFPDNPDNDDDDNDNEAKQADSDETSSATEGLARDLKANRKPNGAPAPSPDDATPVEAAAAVRSTPSGLFSRADDIAKQQLDDSNWLESLLSSKDWKLRPSARDPLVRKIREFAQIEPDVDQSVLEQVAENAGVEGGIVKANAGQADEIVAELDRMIEVARKRK